MYFGESEEGTGSLQVKGEETAEAEGEPSASGPCAKVVLQLHEKSES